VTSIGDIMRTGAERDPLVILARHVSTTGQFGAHQISVDAPLMDEIRHIDVGHLLTWGWSHWRELREAARESMVPPLRRHPVQLGPVTVEFHYQPEITVRWDLGGSFTEKFDLVIVVELANFVAEIEHGCLMRVRADMMRVSFEASVHGKRVLGTKGTALAPDQELELPSPIPLADGASC